MGLGRKWQQLSPRPIQPEHRAKAGPPGSAPFRGLRKLRVDCVAVSWGRNCLHAGVALPRSEISRGAEQSSQGLPDGSPILAFALPETRIDRIRTAIEAEVQKARGAWRGRKTDRVDGPDPRRFKTVARAFAGGEGYGLPGRTFQALDAPSTPKARDVPSAIPHDSGKSVWSFLVIWGWPLQRPRIASDTSLRFMNKSLLLEGGAFYEGPRWHENKLWVSDMHGRQIVTVDVDGRSEVVATVPHRPSGLGWLPSGHLLAVSMSDRKILRLEPSGLVEHANLSSLARHECNDMVVDRQGRAYVGHFGFDHFAHARYQPGSLIAVDPDGTARVVAEDLMFPNGAVIADDGRTMVVAESYGRRLTAFDIESDGTLENRRVWAEVGMAPDGICLDSEGCIWVASPTERAAVRFSEGGEELQRVAMGRKAIACMLGGPDRHTLFVLTSKTTEAHKAPLLRSARIETMTVDVPGAGLP